MSSLPKLPPRAPDAHKGDFGRALLIGGSRGMAGAIALAGMACLRSGAGLVKLAVPECILDTVAGFEPSYMTLPLPCDAEGRIAASAHEQLGEAVAAANCVAFGPGLGKSQGLRQLADWLEKQVTRPMVIDADGLQAWIASRPVQKMPLTGPRIMTPHPGEFARVSNLPATDRATQINHAKEGAREMGWVMVLKAHETFITDGTREATNTTGNPGMATGGTGDVLTGIITALVCQGLSPFDAAVLGAHVHGLAGDLAAAELGQVSMIASDLLKYLPKVFKNFDKP